jgi:hypothetical protein
MARAWWKYVWVLPTSVPGLTVAVLSRERAVVGGVLEVHGGLATWLCRHAPVIRGASAITLGHVIIGRDAECLERARTHEHVHVRQAERWGPLFYPAYLGASAWCLAQGQHPYWDNPFEREAYAP